MYPSRRRRPAFRLVDLLAVIVVAVILIGLLMPTTIAHRMPAERTQCINNNKQIGLAVHNYAYDHHNKLPALASDELCGDYGRYNGGLFVTLLPYLEQEVLFEGGALRLPECTWYGPIPPSTVLPWQTSPPGLSGPPLCAQRLSFYCCPSDSTVTKDGYSANQGPGASGSHSVTFPWSATSYAANYQVFGSQNDLGSAKSGNACLSKYDISSVPDGNSNTVFFGEVFAACGNSAGSLWAYPGIGNYSGTAYTSAAGARAPVGVGNSILNNAGATTSNLWAPVFANSHPKFGFTDGGLEGSIFNPAVPAADALTEPYPHGQFWDAPPQGKIQQSQCDKSRLQSFHTGLVIVTMGDGSARIVATSVSQATWHAAIVPDDGMRLGSDW